MSYAEAAFYGGSHCAHVAAWEEQERLRRIKKRALVILERR